MWQNVRNGMLLMRPLCALKHGLFNKETGEVKEQEIFMGDFPLMTESGTFVINGAERVIVSQLVRSPGVYYQRCLMTKPVKNCLRPPSFPTAAHGLEYETDSNDIFYVRIDKNRKIPITVFIRALLRIATMTIELILEREGAFTDLRTAQILRFMKFSAKTISIVEPPLQDKDTTKNGEEALAGGLPKAASGRATYGRKLRLHICNNLLFDDRRYDLVPSRTLQIQQKAGHRFVRIAGKTLAQPVVNELTGEADGRSRTKLLPRDQAWEIEKAGVDTVICHVEDKDS